METRRKISPPTKRVMRFIMGVLLFPLLLSGCRIMDITAPEAFSIDLLIVDELIAPDTTQVDQPFTITIKGRLPDPSWSFDHLELFIEALSMTIKPIGKEDLEQRVFSQADVPFEKSLDYTPEQTGRLIIEAIGSNQTVTAEVRIVNAINMK